jgi:hypothetical protein
MARFQRGRAVSQFQFPFPTALQTFNVANGLSEMCHFRTSSSRQQVSYYRPLGAVSKPHRA